MIFRRLAVVAALVVAVDLGAQDTTTQQVKPRDTTAREAPHHVMVGSDDENYLRYLQDAGLAAQYPWSVREFSQKELATLAVKRGSHPWSGKGDYNDYPSRFSFKVLPVTIVFRFNSAFPYGSNDGAVWAGRGLTSAIELGFAFRTGPFSVTFNPIAFRAENLPFDIAPAGLSSPNAFADPVFPTVVDRPRRFGSSAYSRVDLGESTLRLDLLGLTAGVSTANMGWSPMGIYPYILGANAPGLLHAFLGTGTPFSIWIGRLHGKVVWGKLEQSAFSPVTGTSYYSSIEETGTRRFMSGVVGTFQPRGIPGLELGVGRFFHSVWPREGLPRSYFTKPFESILKSGLASSSGFNSSSDPGLGDNQLASFFVRWVFPSRGFEFFGEYGREDHNYDFRDLIQELDHSRTYGLGLRKVVSADDSHISAFRAELINYQLPTLVRHRGEGGIYVHGVMRQGHTNRGQLLGSDTGLGSGAGSTLAWDGYSSRGRWTVAWTRTTRQEIGNYYSDGIENPRANNVLHAMTVERAVFSRFGELTSGLTLVREFNRNFDHDSWNVNSNVGVRYHFR